MKDEDGEALAEETKIKERWCKYFIQAF